MNILLVTIDCLRSDHLGCYGYPRNTSPCIDNLALKGAVFLNAISNGGGTPESFPSILASVPPPLHWNGYKRIMKDNLSIAEVLKENGYNTAAFHSNPYLSRYFHYDKGFDVFEDGMDKIDNMRKQWALKSLSEHNNNNFFAGKLLDLSRIIRLIRFQPPIDKAEKITIDAVHWLRNTTRKFFLWIHYMDTHHPRMPPRQYLNEFCLKPISRFQIINLYNKLRKKPQNLSLIEREILINLYDASIKYIDDCLGRFLNTLGTEIDNTLVIITADHGEAFGEHDTFGHSLSLNEEIIHVPLIISGPRVEEDVRVRRQVNHMDIAPTIIDFLNLKTVKSFYGESLVSAIKGKKQKAKGIISIALDPFSRQRAISYRTEKWKYVCNERIYDKGKILHQNFYNLEKDPHEKINLLNVNKEMVQAFKLKIVEYKCHHIYGQEAISKDKEKKEDNFQKYEQIVKDRLKSLGYLD